MLITSKMVRELTYLFVWFGNCDVIGIFLAKEVTTEVATFLYKIFVSTGCNYTSVVQIHN
jgi:hypothetical protein